MSAGDIGGLAGVVPWPRRRLAITASSLLLVRDRRAPSPLVAGRDPGPAAIAGQTTFGGFWRQVWLDVVNAPLYYLVMHLWQGLFGLSDVSLRLPSAIFGAAAPLAIAFWGVKA